MFTHNLYLPIATLLTYYIKPNYSLFLFFLFGLLYTLFHQHQSDARNMPDLPVISYAIIEGTIASIPQVTKDKTQFTIAIHSLNQKPVQALVQLAWYTKRKPVQIGQDWRFAVKLKQPRNYQNPGSFDFKTMLATKHIEWTGYIRPDLAQLLNNNASTYSWLDIRNHFAQKINELAPNQDTAGIIETLTVNISTHISQELWELFRRTGTTHLFGISGEHIALVAGLIFWLLKKIWSRCERCSLRVPALYIASAGALLTALLYSFLAGFGPPVQRALLGCAFYTYCCLGNKTFTSWQIWRYALLGVLLLEPHAVFMQGFYFSFLAVACILLTQQRWRFTGYKSTLALQFSCLIGLMPLSLYWFAYGSLNGYLANLFAIPLVGLLIVPLALLTLLVSHFSWAWLLMKPLSWLIMVLLLGLRWSEYLSAININFALTSLIWVLTLLAALLVIILLPINSFKRFALLWCVLPFLPTKSAIQMGEARIQVLDVGQGLAVAIRTKSHALLYDTGDKFFNGSDLGKMVILPYYLSLNLKKIDTIVISHPDMDHRGGLASVEEIMTNATLLVNEPAFYHRGQNCHDYAPWEWDGVQFQFLPIRLGVVDRNNTSCVLQVSTAAGKVLLTGDIEKIAESYLVNNYAQDLAADYLIIPHHGSKTSSSYRFVFEVHPRYAIASLGFDNRFHFPHTQTLETLQSLGVEFYRTDSCGMVTVDLPKMGKLQAPRCFKTRGP